MLVLIGWIRHLKEKNQASFSYFSGQKNKKKTASSQSLLVKENMTPTHEGLLNTKLLDRLLSKDLFMSRVKSNPTLISVNDRTLNKNADCITLRNTRLWKRSNTPKTCVDEFWSCFLTRRLRFFWCPSGWPSHFDSNHHHRACLTFAF